MVFRELPLDLKLELILIGDELLNGHKKDANLHQLTTYLAAKGLKLRFAQMVSDNIEEISAAFLLASTRSQIIITSGGIGPTLDDLTKDALSSTFKLPLEFSEQAKSVTLANYQRFNRECNFAINRYDQLPQKTIAVNNPTGFAPGIFYQNSEKNFSFLLAPGVPREFKAMVEAYLDNELKKLKNYTPCKQLQWRTFGIPEEKIFSELAPTLWQELANFGSVSSLPHLFGVDIRLTIDASLKENQLKQIEEIITRSGLNTYIWTREHITLPEYIVSLAKKLKLTFSFVESCTGGMAAHLITQVAGCSEVFKGGLVTYQTTIKHKLLNIDSSTTLESGVNEETARAMCVSGKKILESDLCVSFTGFAGPTGGDSENPVGRIWLGIANNKNSQTKKLDLIGSRQDRIERFTYAGLHFLRQELEKLVSL